MSQENTILAALAVVAVGAFGSSLFIAWQVDQLKAQLVECRLERVDIHNRDTGVHLYEGTELYTIDGQVVASRVGDRWVPRCPGVN